MKCCAHIHKQGTNQYAALSLCLILNHSNIVCIPASCLWFLLKKKKKKSNSPVSRTLTVVFETALAVSTFKKQLFFILFLVFINTKFDQCDAHLCKSFNPSQFLRDLFCLLIEELCHLQILQVQSFLLYFLSRPPTNWGKSKQLLWTWWNSLYLSTT